MPGLVLLVVGCQQHRLHGFVTKETLISSSCRLGEPCATEVTVVALPPSTVRNYLLVAFCFPFSPPMRFNLASFSSNLDFGIFGVAAEANIIH